MENVGSAYLSEEENRQFFSNFGYKCQSLAAAIVQLYLTEASSPEEWRKISCGVVFFMKDHERRSYFIQLFEPEGHRMIWEQELYDEFLYDTPTHFFHTFEADDSPAGLNFTSLAEAYEFSSVVLNKIADRERIRDEQALQPHNVPIDLESPIYGTHKASPLKSYLEKRRRKKLRKRLRRRITKADIGSPFGFRHIKHIGLDSPRLSPETEEVNSFISELLESVGMESIMNAEGEREMLFKFIEELGGIRQFRHEGGPDSKKRPYISLPIPCSPQTTLRRPTPPQKPPPPPPKGVSPISTRGKGPPPPPSAAFNPAPTGKKGSPPSPPPHPPGRKRTMMPLPATPEGRESPDSDESLPCTPPPALKGIYGKLSSARSHSGPRREVGPVRFSDPISQCIYFPVAGCTGNGPDEEGPSYTLLQEVQSRRESLKPVQADLRPEHPASVPDSPNSILEIILEMMKSVRPSDSESSTSDSDFSDNDFEL